MMSSRGYHTLTISRPQTPENADKAWRGFKQYKKATGLIETIKREKYKNDPLGRHYTIVYPGQEKGISWKMRFSSRGFCFNGEFMPCSIKATINPKVFTGEKSYITAADSSYIGEVEKRFNEEAQRISPLLGRFNDYSLNRLDYCLNFDVSELGLDLPPEQAKDLPKRIMQLIKYGDIPEHYHLKDYEEEYEFYLKSKSVVINCYWKHVDLEKNFSDCPDLNKSQDIIRFEVQFWYPKTYAAVAKLKRERNIQRAVLREELQQQGFFEFSYDDTDSPKSEQLCEMFRKSGSIDTLAKILEGMMSDEKCSDVIDKYFYDVIKPGDYYTFDVARRLIEARVSSWEKAVRLTRTLALVRDCEGITKAKAMLRGKDLEEFRRSLRELGKLGINPVTLPSGWGIDYIPNLLDNYYRLLQEERLAAETEKLNQQMLEDYIRDCGKRGVPWYT